MENCKLLIFLLLTAAAWGQTADIQGLKIKKSGFDAKSKTVSLTFINERVADITAYRYCFAILSTDPRQTRKQCILIDALTSILEMKAARQARPLLPEITLLGPGQNVVHPGEERIIEERIGYNASIFDGSISIDAVVWSDDTFEGDAQLIIAERTAEVQERQFVSRAIKDELSRTQESMVVSVVAALRQEQQEVDRDRCFDCQDRRTHVLMDAIYHLQQPERHIGNTREFVPENQREFLKQFLVRYDSFSEENAKHVSLRKTDE